MVLVKVARWGKKGGGHRLHMEPPRTVTGGICTVPINAVLRKTRVGY